MGRGGVSVVAKAVGISRTTIYAGMEELKSTTTAAADVAARRWGFCAAC
jgi:DNA-binding phage protein